MVQGSLQAGNLRRNINLSLLLPIQHQQESPIWGVMRGWEENLFNENISVMEWLG